MIKHQSIASSVHHHTWRWGPTLLLVSGFLKSNWNKPSLPSKLKLLKKILGAVRVPSIIHWEPKDSNCHLKNWWWGNIWLQCSLCSLLFCRHWGKVGQGPMAHKHKEDAEEAKVLQSCEKIQLPRMEVTISASSHKWNTLSTPQKKEIHYQHKGYANLEPEENIEQQDCSYSCMEKRCKCSRSWQRWEVLQVHSKTHELQENAVNRMWMC